MCPLKEGHKVEGLQINLCSIQYAEHLKHKQGHLLRATHSTYQIRKLIFLSGVLGNVSLKQFHTPLPFCIVVSPFALKKVSIGLIPDVVTSPGAPHIPKARFMSQLYTLLGSLLLLQLCLCETAGCVL